MAIHYPFITYCCLCLTLFYWKRLGFGSSYYRRPREAVFRSYPFFLQKYLAPLKICWIFQRPLKKLHSDLKLHIPLNLIQMVTLLKKWPTPELFNPVNQSNKQTNKQPNKQLIGRTMVTLNGFEPLFFLCVFSTLLRYGGTEGKIRRNEKQLLKHLFEDYRWLVVPLVHVLPIRQLLSWH